MIGMAYNENLHIVEVIYKGVIELEDIFEFGTNIEQNPYLPRKLRMLTDATQAKYNFSVDKIPLLAKNLEEHTKDFEWIKAAFIQSRPNETAISMILENENKSSHYIHRIFYTRESALEWLLNDEDFDDK